LQPSEAISRAVIKTYITRRLFKTAETYELHIWAYMRAFFTGEVDAFGFLDLMAAEIENQYWRAWREGAEIMDVYPEDFTPEDDAQVESMINDNIDYLDGVAGDIEAFIAEGGHTDQEFNDSFRHRAVLWARGYDRTVDQAKLHFGDKEKLEWVLGDSEESCQTCLGLSGIVAWAREWEEAGVLPGGSMLACGGWQCHCQLEQTNKRRTGKALSRILDIMTAANV
jgi:hypothetical protein